MELGYLGPARGWAPGLPYRRQYSRQPGDSHTQLLSTDEKSGGSERFSKLAKTTQPSQDRAGLEVQVCVNSQPVLMPLFYRTHSRKRELAHWVLEPL